MAKQRNTAAKQTGNVLIDFPVGEIDPDCYVGNHVDVHLDHRQKVAMRRLLNGMLGQKLANGRLVQTYGDVVRHICDRVAEAT